jgi:hypothetical protein
MARTTVTRRRWAAGAAALALAGAALALPAPASAAASVKLSPTKGPNGTVVKATGSCGAPMAVQAQARVGSAAPFVSAYGYTSGSGTYSLSLKMRNASHPLIPKPGAVKVSVSCLSYHGPTTTASATFTVTPVIKPIVTLISSSIRVKSGKPRVTIRCTKARCQGTLKITIIKTVKSSPVYQLPIGKGSIHRVRMAVDTATTKKVTVLLASANYSVSSGKKVVVALTPTKAGKAAFRKATRKHPVKATLTIAVKKGSTVKKSVSIW